MTRKACWVSSFLFHRYSQQRQRMKCSSRSLCFTCRRSFKDNTSNSHSQQPILSVSSWLISYHSTSTWWKNLVSINSLVMVFSWSSQLCNSKTWLKSTKKKSNDKPAESHLHIITTVNACLEIRMRIPSLMGLNSHLLPQTSIIEAFLIFTLLHYFLLIQCFYLSFSLSFSINCVK